MSRDKDTTPAEREITAAQAKTRGVQAPLTDERKTIFLRAIAEGALPAMAARAASPLATGPRGALSTFNAARRRDPDFAAAWGTAVAESNARIEAEVFRRAMTGVEVPVHYKGKQATDAEGRPLYTTVYSDRLLERLAESRMPERWTPSKRLQHSATDGDKVAVLRAADVARLPAQQQRELAKILVEMSRLRAADVDGASGADIADAEYFEVSEADMRRPAPAASMLLIPVSDATDEDEPTPDPDPDYDPDYDPDADF